MKTTTSSWMPHAADESTLLELMREMLRLDIRIARRPDGGFRISVDSAEGNSIGTRGGKKIPQSV